MIMMIIEVIVEIMQMNCYTRLMDYLALLRSWGSEKRGIICCSRSAATAELIVRQRGVASELTNFIPTAITATESLEREMINHLPPGDSLSTTLSSPQFSQALSMFWSALQSAQAGPVIRQFGLGPDAVNAAASGNLEEFVTALESEAKTSTHGGTTGGQQQSQQQSQQQPDDDNDEKTKKQTPSSGPPSAKKEDNDDDDDDEGMALD